MLSLGVDVVEIERFKDWPKFSRKTLSKIFDESEIDYCLSNKAKSAERFASHFAAKEAFFKAVCPLLSETKSLLFVLKNINLERDSLGIPNLCVNWPTLKLKYDGIPRIIVSISHSKTVTFATVILV